MKKRTFAIAPTEAAVLQGYLDELRKIGLRPARLMVFELQQSPTPRPATVKSARRESEAGESLRALVEAWHALFKDRASTAGDALRMSTELTFPEARALNLVLRNVCRERGLPLSPRHIGNWLRAHERQGVGGKAFVRSGARDHSNLWRLIEAKAS